MPKHQKHFRYLVWGRASLWNLSVVPAASIVWLQLQSLVIGHLCSEIVMTLSAMSTMWMPAMSDFVTCLVLLCWGSGNCLFTLARVCQGGSELIPDLNFCCFDLFRQKRLEHWGSSSVIIWTQTTCSCKSLSKNPSLMNAQWSPPVWINPFCETLSHSVPECIDSTRVYELRTILPTTYRSPTVSCNIQLVIPSSVHSLNRRIEISSSLEWSCAAVGK